ncbi:AIR carboxylase family protein [Chitinophaga terrae (ex Kim and Jung 2007)]|uniref:AIR carboxylase family protein n=1 Tax=Chitinophaga terrae (ex Kim and Jung 2007) TaxID=408074 RepID=UPI0011142D55
MYHCTGKRIGVIIAAAGMAAALPGVVLAHISLPVLGVPLEMAVCLAAIKTVLQPERLQNLVLA